MKNNPGIILFESACNFTISLYKGLCLKMYGLLCQKIKYYLRTIYYNEKCDGNCIRRLLNIFNGVATNIC